MPHLDVAKLASKLLLKDKLRHGAFLRVYLRKNQFKLPAPNIEQRERHSEQL